MDGDVSGEFGPFRAKRIWRGRVPRALPWA